MTPGTPRPVTLAAWLLTVLVFSTCQSHAQQAEVRASGSPHYVGVPIDIEVTVAGFERAPEPTIDVAPPAGTVLELVSVNPKISSSIQIVNGRVTRSERVHITYRYRLLTERAGDVEVGPFHITQGSREARARAVRFKVEDVPTTAEQRFRLLLPDGPLWVGQRVPVTLEWWLTEAFADRLAGRRARVPLFDHVDRFTFEDADMPDAKQRMTVDTATGTLELPARVRRAEWKGKPYLVVTAERTMIALKAGAVTIAAASIVTEEALRWSTDFFGQRVPAGLRRLRVVDEERTLSFKSPPAAGRPPSFAGAVGKGFALAVSADRSVVKAGDPIRLNIDVHGDAALETVSLPDLALSGLDARDFKIPHGTIAGSVADGAKRFDVVVRVNNDQIREIPPLAFSWFDPDRGEYATTHSRPIAVSVSAATVVSAADVVTTATAQGEDAQAQVDESPAPASARPAGVRPAFTLSGAELSIETRATALLQRPAPWYARPAALGVMYLGGFGAVGLALAARRRTALAPEIRARRQTLEAERRTVARAPGVGDLARALRRMAAASAPLPRDEYEALLVECDNLAYAPSAGDDAPVDARLRARALAVADAILEAAT